MAKSSIAQSKLVGQRFNNWTILSLFRDNNILFAQCRCVCGTVRNVRVNNLKNNTSRSCGCIKRKFKTEGLIGKQFGNFTVLDERTSQYKCGMKYREVLTQCVCGRKRWRVLSQVINGKIVSCGCLTTPKKTHGLSDHKIYNLWEAIKQRCLNPVSQGYENYGNRGITICDEWKDDPKAFYDWAMKNGWGEGLYLDRKNNDIGYNPNNCRFVTPSISMQNTRLLSTKNTSGYRGVSNFRNKSWQAYVSLNHKFHFIGYYKTPEEAARAYDAKVKELGSEHPLNFP